MYDALSVFVLVCMSIYFSLHDVIRLQDKCLLKLYTTKNENNPTSATTKTTTK